MEVLYSTGMRVGALLGLRVRDIRRYTKDHDDHEIMRAKGRGGGHPRTFFMIPRTLAKLLAYIDKHGLKDNDLIFMMTVRCIEKFVKKAAVKILKKKGLRFHPHLFRHHFATHWYKRGILDDSLRRMMGHSSFHTTARWYIHTLVSTGLRRNDYKHPLDWIEA